MARILSSGLVGPSESISHKKANVSIVGVAGCGSVAFNSSRTFNGESWVGPADARIGDHDIDTLPGRVGYCAAEHG